MAFTVDFIDQTTGHPRFNVDQTVRRGTRGPDGTLIQVLLNLLYFDLQPAAARFGFTPPTDRLVEDGIVGDQTVILASHFFDAAPKSAGLVDFTQHPEAVGVDPMRAPGQLSTRLHVRYFMDALNTFCSSLSAQLGNDRFRLLASAKSTPVSLRNALRTRKAVADKYRFGG